MLVAISHFVPDQDKPTEIMELTAELILLVNHLLGRYRERIRQQLGGQAGWGRSASRSRAISAISAGGIGSRRSTAAFCPA
jgi:hypothetical protein